jgi:tight adherence protein B
MSPLVLGAIVLGLVILIGAALVLAPGGGAQRLVKRARKIGTRGQTQQIQSGPQLRRDRPGGLDAFITRLVPRPDALRQRLASSGLSLTIGAYAAWSAGVAVCVMAGAIFEKLPVPAAILVGLFAGLVLPHLFIGSRIGARRKKFSKLFPDAIGLMVRGLKAGLPATESILVVGRECADPVGEDFRRVGDQVRLGQPLEDALWTVAKRLDLPEFNFLVITLSIQRETGGNLAETLQNLDTMLRMRSQMKLKIKAMSSEATATAGIIGSLPFAMGGLLFFVAQKYIVTLFTESLGHIFLACGFVWLSIGVFIMSQMVKFEI